jgi:acyl carrier protein
MIITHPTSTHLSLENVILTLVAATLGHKSVKTKPDDSLLSGRNGFDSFSLMEFVLRLEEAFGLTIPDEDLDPDIFYSVKTIAVYLRARLEQQD